MDATGELAENQILLGERNYEAATALLLEQAQRQLKIFAPDLSRGGYQSPEVARLLRDFLARDRENRLTIVMHDSRFFMTECPRLVELARLYGHALTIYLTAAHARVAQDAFVLADDLHCLHRFHVDQARFRYRLHDQAAARPLHERFAQLLESTASVLSVDPLGL